MNRLHKALAEMQAWLAERDLDWALIGGLAVSVRAEPRFTRDVDLAVAVETDQDAERLLRELRGDGYRILETVEQEAAGRLATARLVPPGEESEGVVVDLLFASSGIESEIIASAEALEILPGLEAPVAGVAELMTLKLLARDDQTRPQDATDLRALAALATPEDLATVRRLACLIEDRNYHRGRDLGAELDRVIG